MGILVGSTAIAKYTGGLKQQTFISHSSGGWKFKIRAPTWSGSGESSLPGLQTADLLLCPHMAEGERVCSPTSLLTRAQIPSLGPYPHDVI